MECQNYPISTYTQDVIFSGKMVGSFGRLIAMADNACKAEMESMHNNVEIIQREGQFVYFTMWEHRGHAFQRKDEQIGRARSMPSG